MEKSLMELLREEQIWVDKLREAEIDVKTSIDMNDGFNLNDAYKARKEAKDNLDMVRRNIIRYHRSLFDMDEEPVRQARARYE